MPLPRLCAGDLRLGPIALDEGGDLGAGELDRGLGIGAVANEHDVVGELHGLQAVLRALAGVSDPLLAGEIDRLTATQLELLHGQCPPFLLCPGEIFPR